MRHASPTPRAGALAPPSLEYGSSPETGRAKRLCAFDTGRFLHPDDPLKQRGFCESYDSTEAGRSRSATHWSTHSDSSDSSLGADAGSDAVLQPPSLPLDATLSPHPTTPPTMQTQMLTREPFTPPAAPKRAAPTQLQKALQANSAERVRALLEEDPNAAMPPLWGLSAEPPLCLAAKLHCGPEVFSRLLEGGADVNAANAVGLRPLEVVRRSRHPATDEIVRRLLAAGATPQGVPPCAHASAHSCNFNNMKDFSLALPPPPPLAFDPAAFEVVAGSVWRN